MVSDFERNISGTWFGNYYYSDLSQACSFEAVFLQAGPSVEGSILDDGMLGEARVVGSFAGIELSFQKIYNNAGHLPVHYLGTLGDDGKSLAGTWRISEECRGSWKAWRMDGEELLEVRETNVELEEEKVLVRTRPQSR